MSTSTVRPEHLLNMLNMAKKKRMTSNDRFFPIFNSGTKKKKKRNYGFYKFIQMPMVSRNRTRNRENPTPGQLTD